MTWVSSRVPLVLACALAAGCGSEDGGGSGSGGSGGTGATSTGGTGGSSGGTGGTGGTVTGGTGGSSGSGGVAGSGGATGGTGGTAGTGGSSGACGAITTFATGLSPTTERHVSPAGNDTTGDGSAGKPYKTIQKAAQNIQPGTAIRIHTGTYPGGTFLAGLSGTAAAPIWIGGAPGEAPPVISGGSEGLHFTKARYLVLHDIEVSNATDNGINVDDGGEYSNIDATRFVLFDKLNIHDIGSTGNQDCLKLSGVNDYWVLGSKFSKCGGGMSGSGIDHVGCHKGLIAHDTFENMSGNAVQAKGGSEDIEIRACRMKNAGERAVNMGGSTGLTFFRPPLSTTGLNFEAKNIRVIANIIQGGTASVAFVGCVECLAANNTIVNPTNWILRILQETVTGTGGYTFLAAQKGRFVNNLVYFDRSDLSTYVNVGAGTAADTFEFSNNLWYAHDNPAQSTPTDLPATETAAVTGQDPAFASVATDDFSIQATSPAAGAGKALAEVKAAHDDKCYASPPSIGAFEPLP